MNRRMAMWVVVLAGLLALTAGWSYRRLVSAREALAQANGDLAECRRLAGQIQLCRDRPNVAAEFERVASETAGPIERAARAAGVSPDRLLRISPEPAQRVGDSVYKEKPTRVSLKDVTLKQLVTLVHGLTSADAGLRVKSILLHAPNQEDPSDSWTAEVVLAYLIYEPTGQAK